MKLVDMRDSKSRGILPYRFESDHKHHLYIIKHPNNQMLFQMLLFYKNITTSSPTIKQYTEKYISFPSLTIFLNHLVTKNVTIAATTTARV